MINYKNNIKNYYEIFIKNNFLFMKNIIKLIKRIVVKTNIDNEKNDRFVNRLYEKRINSEGFRNLFTYF